MSWQAQPTRSGTYRVKVYGSADNGWMYIPDQDRWVCLRSIDNSDIQFKFELTQVSGDTFTIRPAFDKTLYLTQSPTGDRFGRGKYWGYGYTEGKREEPATNWRIRKSNDGKYSKILVSGTSNVLDSRDEPHNCVHFYQDQDNSAANNQRWVFQAV